MPIFEEAILRTIFGFLEYQVMEIETAPNMILVPTFLIELHDKCLKQVADFIKALEAQGVDTMNGLRFRTSLQFRISSQSSRKDYENNSYFIHCSLAYGTSFDSILSATYFRLKN